MKTRRDLLTEVLVAHYHGELPFICRDCTLVAPVAFWEVGIDPTERWGEDALVCPICWGIGSVQQLTEEEAFEVLEVDGIV